ncbi:hypothetical protein ES288_D06G097600v1 [Gossypium darwinii]|uniref:Uncharacterized protein n=1 Tax=Gossypium darwinii TaxID=34276 RepID=A0A5D2C845_GOSDA|nr:hypothetical protein ES288_D06G097600v1 [Gossypium darwinii]
MLELSSTLSSHVRFLLQSLTEANADSVFRELCQACFSKHSQWPPKSFRLSPGWRACAASFLPWMFETFYDLYIWPPESFRFSPGLRACAAFILPWMSETFYYIFIIVSLFKYNL